MNEALGDLLRSICGERERLARFLNTVSLLEYIGARKIFKSQLEQEVDASTLAHAAEEIRHAQVFKSLARDVGERQLWLKYYDKKSCLGRDEAVGYIQGVDEAVCSVLDPPDSKLAYRMTTLLVEERAGRLFPLLDEALMKAGIASPLRSIMLEEESHLRQMQSCLKEEPRLTDETWRGLRQIENGLFDAWILAIKKELSCGPEQTHPKTDSSSLCLH